MINNFSVSVGGKRAQPTLEAAKYNKKSKQYKKCGVSGNIEGFKPEYFTRHVEEEGHKHAQEFFSTKIVNVAVLGPMDVCTNVITPKTHAQLKA